MLEASVANKFKACCYPLKVDQMEVKGIGGWADKCVQGTNGGVLWCELKRSKARADSSFSIPLRPDQRVWMYSRALAGGSTACFMGVYNRKHGDLYVLWVPSTPDDWLTCNKLKLDTTKVVSCLTTKREAEIRNKFHPEIYRLCHAQ